jgi:hypothetical protein
MRRPCEFVTARADRKRDGLAVTIDAELEVGGLGTGECHLRERLRITQAGETNAARGSDAHELHCCVHLRNV